MLLALAITILAGRLLCRRCRQQGTLLSVFATLDMAGLDLRRWLAAFLRECAGIGRNAVVVDPCAWLPWGMPEQRLQALQAAGRSAGPDP